MPLKTDYKNYIPSTTTKIHDIKQASDGTVINAEVILEDVTIYSQEGDAFGSADINATNAQVNANTDAIALKAPLSSPEFTDISTFTGLVDLQSGQIKFPATQVPSADPNTLDDYEEGTWNAVLSATVTPPTTPITMVGIYTKIGREVTVTVAFNDVDTTGASGDMFVHGLPFMAKTHECYGLAGQYNLASVPLMCSSVVNDTYLSIRSYETTIYAPIVAGTLKYLLIQCTYLAD